MDSPYEPLRSNSALRVVVIHAGEPGDLVNCATLQLDDQEQTSCQYRALSYLWGPVDEQYLIKLDGVEFRVRRSLFYALQHLRKPDEDVRLWIDAISIDQNSQEEKATQIPRMKTIFSGAQEVILWLGEEDSTSGRGMRLLDEIFVDHRQDDVSRSPEISPELDFRSEMLVHALKHDSSYKALSSLFSREFWSRTWIVQEVVLATELIVHCGRHSVSWEAFEINGQGPLALLQQLDQEFDMNKCFERWIDRYHTLARGIIEHRRERLVAEKDLPALLDRYHYADATKIYDKIYGMFAMWESPYKSSLTVEYQREILHLYGDVMRVCENTATDIEDFSVLLQESLKLITPQVSTLIRDRLPDQGTAFSDPHTAIHALAAKRWNPLSATRFMHSLNEELASSIPIPIVAVFKGFFLQSINGFPCPPLNVLQAIGRLDLCEMRKNRKFCIFEQYEEPGNATGSGWRARPHLSQDEIEAASLPAGIESGTHRMRFLVCVTGVTMGIWLVSAEARFEDIIYPYVMQEDISVVLRQCVDGCEVIGKAIYLDPYRPEPPLEHDQGHWAMMSQQELDVPTHLTWRKSIPAVDSLEPHRRDSRLPSLETHYSLSLVSSSATELATPDEEVGSEASTYIPMIDAVPSKTLEVEEEEKESELAFV